MVVNGIQCLLKLEIKLFTKAARISSIFQDMQWSGFSHLSRELLSFLLLVAKSLRNRVPKLLNHVTINLVRDIMKTLKS